MSKLQLEYAGAQAAKSLKSLPRNISIESFDSVINGGRSTLPIEHLSAIGPGVFEMKINGRPAFRCVYTTKVSGKVVILHAFKKTTNGPDQANLKTVKDRLKSL